MKQINYIVLFVLLLISGLVISNTLTKQVESIKEIDLEGLQAFKSPDRTFIKFPMRLSKAGKVECLSLDGE